MYKSIFPSGSLAKIMGTCVFTNMYTCVHSFRYFQERVCSMYLYKYYAKNTVKRNTAL